MKEIEFHSADGFLKYISNEILEKNLAAVFEVKNALKAMF